jgi:polyisoprenoid-binding protein YceI
MKKLQNTLVVIALLAAVNAMGQVPEKYISSKTHIKFFSSTPVEDIEANNYTSVSTINPTTGDVVFSVPMQSFEFEKALMQQHFNNEHFLETNVYPKSKFKGIIINLNKINFTKDGVYQAEIEGELTIKDIKKPVKLVGSIEVKGKTLIINSVFNITLADYGIAFDESEMVSTKIGKSIKITVLAEYN